jgi:plastocyanin
MKRTLLLVGSSLFLAACYHTPTAADIDRMDAEKQATAAQEETQATKQGVGEVVSVEIENFAFSPKALTVKPGATITVTNRDVAEHTMTSDDGSSFDTQLIGKDQTVELTAPTRPGTYDFHCTPHPNIKGTLVVESE